MWHTLVVVLAEAATWTTKDVIQLGVVLAGIFASWYNLKERQKITETKLAPIYDWFIGRATTKAKSASNGGI